MHHRHNYTCYSNHHRSGEPAHELVKGPKKIVTVTKAIRAMTAIVVFGIPLVTGTVALLGYGLHEAYKRMTGRS